MAEKEPGVPLTESAQAIVNRIVEAGNEVRELKKAGKDFAGALAALKQAKSDYKNETGSDYVAPGSKKKSGKAAKKAARAAKAAERKRQTAQAEKEGKIFHPRYIEPDESKLTPDTRGEPQPAAQEETVQKVTGQPFYITTAINYTNGKPHIGHAYEAVTADIIARYHRVFGREVFFLTGSDEHGKKVQDSAAAAGVEPIEIANKYSQGFQDLNAMLKISNDRYIRTTEPEHELTAQMMFQRAEDAGDIYLHNYEGWYDVREERFVPDNEAELAGFKDEHGRPLEKHNEASYHFRMSKYQERLVEHIKMHPEFIQPESQRNMILKRLEEPLQDLSASRPLESLTWGVPLPNDPTHVMYVWFDALTNYITGINYRNEDDPLRNTFWPCNVHIVGRDIMWFHCVIWPCMLMSANIPLPRTIFGHGWVLAVSKDNNELVKMSKSIGNVVDPVAILGRFLSDTFRLYLVDEATYGENMGFQLENMIVRHNNQLSDTLGNLVHRICNLIVKLHGGKQPDYPSFPPGPERPFDSNVLKTEVESHMKAFRLREASHAIWEACRKMNNWLYKVEPWKIKGEGAETRTGPIMRTAVEGIYILAHHFAPYIPDAVARIEIKLNRRIGTISGLREEWDNIPAGTPIEPRGILFAKIPLTEQEEAKMLGKTSGGGGGKGNQKKTAGKKKTKADVAPVVDIFAKMQLVVGRINKCWEHEESEKLFCEEIDVGEEKPLRVASKLRAFYTREHLEGQPVIVVRNLKAAKMAGFKSEGMVLCACTESSCELLQPPADAKLGERLTVEGIELQDPLSTKQVQKRKALPKLIAGLCTADDSTVGVLGLTK